MRAVADTSGVIQARRPHDSVESLIVVVVDVNNGRAGSISRLQCWLSGEVKTRYSEKGNLSESSGADTARLELLPSNHISTSRTVNHDSYSRRRTCPKWLIVRFAFISIP